MTSGSATAMASRRRVSTPEIVIAGGDSSSTGSSVQADIDHSEVMSVPLASAPTTGSSKGPQNAAAASRRSGVAPATPYRRASRGRGAPRRSAIITGIAT